jgi:hypothetical protein
MVWLFSRSVTHREVQPPQPWRGYWRRELLGMQHPKVLRIVWAGGVVDSSESDGGSDVETTFCSAGNSSCTLWTIENVEERRRLSAGVDFAGRASISTLSKRATSGLVHKLTLIFPTSQFIHQRIKYHKYNRNAEDCWNLLISYILIVMIACTRSDNIATLHVLFYFSLRDPSPSANSQILRYLWLSLLSASLTCDAHWLMNGCGISQFLFPVCVLPLP